MTINPSQGSSIMAPPHFFALVSARRCSAAIEPPWYGPVCPVVWEGRSREVPPYPDQSVITFDRNTQLFRKRRCLPAIAEHHGAGPAAQRRQQPDRLGTTEGACRDPAERPGRAVCRLRPRRQFVATEALAETGLHHIQAASFVSPKIVPGWADAEDVVAGFTPKEGVTYTGLWFNAAGLNRALVFRNKLTILADRVRRLGSRCGAELRLVFLLYQKGWDPASFRANRLSSWARLPGYYPLYAIKLRRCRPSTKLAATATIMIGT